MRCYLKLRQDWLSYCTRAKKILKNKFSSNWTCIGLSAICFRRCAIFFFVVDIFLFQTQIILQFYHTYYVAIVCVVFKFLF